MKAKQRQELIGIAKRRIKSADGSHDFLHAWRVLKLAERINEQEGGNTDVVVAAALFHDLIVHSKDSPRTAFSSDDSAREAGKILGKLKWFPAKKIPAVRRAIALCSFTKNLPKETIEDQIIQDADMLESVGAISVARTFNSGGILGRTLYDGQDPTARHRPLAPGSNSLDLFPARLFQVRSRLQTKAAKKIARRRDRFVRKFFAEFLKDIVGE